jgi:hypothetical protein
VEVSVVSDSSAGAAPVDPYPIDRPVDSVFAPGSVGRRRGHWVVPLERVRVDDEELYPV